jgi:hypothetical protein
MFHCKQSHYLPFFKAQILAIIDIKIFLTLLLGLQSNSINYTPSFQTFLLNLLEWQVMINKKYRAVIYKYLFLSKANSNNNEY